MTTDSSVLVPADVNLALEIEAKDALWAAFKAAGGSVANGLAFAKNQGLINHCVAKLNPRFINCNELPVKPDWAKEMTKNAPGGLVDSSTVTYFQTDAMKSGNWTVGTELGAAARNDGFNPANATFGQKVHASQDELLKDVPKEIQVLICTETEFLDGGGVSYFVCLYRDGGRWHLDFCWTDSRFGGRYAVLVSASKLLVP